MPTSSITDRFVLDDKGAKQLLEIIENSKAHPAKKIYKSNKYEEGVCCKLIIPGIGNKSP